jgi:hypothetical protein
MSWQEWYDHPEIGFWPSVKAVLGLIVIGLCIWILVGAL